MEGILGKKVGMTHIFTGTMQVPVTVVQAGPVHIVQKKTVAKDGYDALQVGFSEKKPSRVSKPLAGHVKKAGAPTVYHLKEFKTSDIDKYSPGDIVKTSDVVEVGNFVDVSSKSKGKGFQGVVKRWNFKGGPAGHGSMHGRTSGSVGQGSDPSKVFKGMKMPGQTGNKRITVQNVEVVGIRNDGEILLLKGAIPGSRGTLIEIRKALKK